MIQTQAASTRKTQVIIVPTRFRKSIATAVAALTRVAQVQEAHAVNVAQVQEGNQVARIEKE